MMTLVQLRNILVIILINTVNDVHSFVIYTTPSKIVAADLRSSKPIIHPFRGPRLKEVTDKSAEGSLFVTFPCKPSSPSSLEMCNTRCALRERTLHGNCDEGACICIKSRSYRPPAGAAGLRYKTNCSVKKNKEMCLGHCLSLKRKLKGVCNEKECLCVASSALSRGRRSKTPQRAVKSSPSPRWSRTPFSYGRKSPSRQKSSSSSPSSKRKSPSRSRSGGRRQEDEDEDEDNPYSLPSGKKKSASGSPKQGKASRTPKRSKTSSTPTRGKTSSTPTRGKTSSTPTRGKTSSTPTRGKTSSTPTRGKTSRTPTKKADPYAEDADDTRQEDDPYLLPSVKSKSPSGTPKRSKTSGTPGKKGDPYKIDPYARDDEEANGPGALKDKPYDEDIGLYDNPRPNGNRTPGKKSQPSTPKKQNRLDPSDEDVGLYDNPKLNGNITPGKKSRPSTPKKKNGLDPDISDLLDNENERGRNKFDEPGFDEPGFDEPGFEDPLAPFKGNPELYDNSVPSPKRKDGGSKTPKGRNADFQENDPFSQRDPTNPDFNEGFQNPERDNPGYFDNNFPEDPIDPDSRDQSDPYGDFDGYDPEDQLGDIGAFDDRQGRP